MNPCTTNFIVQYEDINLSICELKIIERNLVLKEPCIKLKQTKSDVYYSILMLDPDAPNGMNSSNNNTFLHWWISNISFDQNGKYKEAEEWVKYMPPSPPKGKHRYYFYLLEHVSKIQKDRSINNENRVPFSIDKFGYEWKMIDIKGYIVEAK